MKFITKFFARHRSRLAVKKWNMEAFRRTATAEKVTVGLAAGADPNARNKCGLTFLHWAVVNHFTLIKILVKGDADINAKDKVDQTPLHFAARNDSGGAPASALLEAGAKGQRRKVVLLGRMFRQTARARKLIRVAFYGDASRLRRLIQKGANVNAGYLDEDGNTPLHVVAKFARRGGRPC